MLERWYSHFSINELSMCDKRDNIYFCDNSSTLTRQDGRKERKAKGLCVKSLSGLVPACFFRALILKLLGLGFYKKICLKEGEFFGKCFSEIY